MLKDVAVLAAPIAPFYMDQLWLDLVPSSESVHFELMPEADSALVDKDLEERMALAQKATSMILALRKKSRLNVRQPLAKVLIPVISEKVRGQLEKVKDLILNEVNVKEAEFITDTAGLITKKIKPNFKTLGKAYGKQMKEIAAAFGTFDQATISAIQEAETAGTAYALALPGGEVLLNPGDYQITSEDMTGWLVATEGQLTIALDIAVTDELKKEGLARELINRIQNARKDGGFAVTDRVLVEIWAKGNDFFEIAAAVDDHYEYVTSQTLSEIDSVSPDPAPADAVEAEWNEGVIRLRITKNTN